MSEQGSDEVLARDAWPAGYVVGADGSRVAIYSGRDYWVRLPGQLVVYGRAWFGPDGVTVETLSMFDEALKPWNDASASRELTFDGREVRPAPVRLDIYSGDQWVSGTYSGSQDSPPSVLH